MTGSQPGTSGEDRILAELATVGYDVHSLADLRHSGLRYRQAIPILIGALAQDYDERTLEEVVRALSVPWAKPTAIPPLVRAFRKVKGSDELGLRWTIGNALEVTWDDSAFEDLVTLACDRSLGRSREMIVLGLGRSKRAEAGAVLIELLDDPSVNGHAVKALRKLKVAAAQPGLERMVHDPRAWVRRDARKALNAFEHQESSE
jgi:HEAT repeat protein